MLTILPSRGATQKKVYRILYADDLKELRDIASLGLGREGHTVECVADGALALQRVMEDPFGFDLVISDHHMPNMNGLELVKRLRALRYSGKIVIFSSELSYEVTDAYQQLQVERMLFKPIELSVLRNLIQEI